MSVSVCHPCFAQAELSEYTLFCLFSIPEVPASYYSPSFTEMYFYILSFRLAW